MVDTHADHVTSLFFSLRHDELAAWEAGGLERWKDRCAALMPAAAELIHSGIRTKEQVSFARYGDGSMWRFNKGRTAGGAVALADAKAMVAGRLRRSDSQRMLESSASASSHRHMGRRSISHQ